LKDERSTDPKDVDEKEYLENVFFISLPFPPLAYEEKKGMLIKDYIDPGSLPGKEASSYGVKSSDGH
jgi:hypothetical protein